MKHTYSLQTEKDSQVMSPRSASFTHALFYYQFVLYFLWSLHSPKESTCKLYPSPKFNQGGPSGRWLNPSHFTIVCTHSPRHHLRSELPLCCKTNNFLPSCYKSPPPQKLDPAVVTVNKEEPRLIEMHRFCREKEPRTEEAPRAATHYKRGSM